MKKEDALYELGRYQRKVAAQRVEINGLKDAMKGYEELCEIYNVYLALLLQHIGAVSPDTAFPFKREDIIQSRGKYAIVNNSDDVNFRFRLYVREAVTDGREGEETDATEQG